MPKIHPGATLTPGFDTFLPSWVARQRWAAGSPADALRPVGHFRLDDPDGEVGMETHLLRDLGHGDVVYQVPLTYRDAPLPLAGSALVATAEHSVLGTRWIYDATVDPVWAAAMVDLAARHGTSEPAGRRGLGPAEARGDWLDPAEPADLTPGRTAVELHRWLPARSPALEPGIVGLVHGSWHPDGTHGTAVTGCLAVVRKRERHAGRASQDDSDVSPA